MFSRVDEGDIVLAEKDRKMNSYVNTRFRPSEDKDDQAGCEAGV